MAKEYFSHDYNTRDNYKIMPMMMKHGIHGYGLYWCIIEDLYKNTNVLQSNYEVLAYKYRCDTDLVRSIICDFGLFYFSGENDECFHSEGVQERLDMRDQKSVKARESINKRWKTNESNTNVYDKNTNVILKERKGKEIKGNKIKEVIPSPVIHQEENFEKITENNFKNKERAGEKQKTVKTFFTMTIEEFRKSIPEWDESTCQHYYKAAENYSNKGNKYIDWIKAVKNWAERDKPKVITMPTQERKGFYIPK